MYVTFIAKYYIFLFLKKVSYAPKAAFNWSKITVHGTFEKKKILFTV